MAYSQETDFLKRMSKKDLDDLTAPVAGDGLTAADILNVAIETADDIIDSYISSVVSEVPLDEPPKTIVQCSVDIAIYHLHSRIQFDHIPEFIIKKYDDQIAWLKDISSGKANLNLAESEQDEEISRTTYGREDRKMSRGTI